MGLATTVVQKARGLSSISILPSVAMGALPAGRSSLDFNVSELRAGDKVDGASLVGVVDANISVIGAFVLTAADATGAGGVVRVQFYNSNVPLNSNLSIAPTGIPASVAANTTVDIALTGITGLLATDTLIAVNKAADQAGLAVSPGPGALGGVTGAGAATVRYVNDTVGAIVPTAGEIYNFGISRGGAAQSVVGDPVEILISVARR